MPGLWRNRAQRIQDEVAVIDPNEITGWIDHCTNHDLLGEMAKHIQERMRTLRPHKPTPREPIKPFPPVKSLQIGGEPEP